MSNKLPKGVTADDVKAWKKEHGKIRQFTVKKDDGTEVSCILRTPDRKVMGAALQAQKSDPIRSKEIVLVNCWLAGDEEIKTNDALFLSVASQLDDLIEIKETEVKEL
jgi:hypothetical protein